MNSPIELHVPDDVVDLAKWMGCLNLSPPRTPSLAHDRICMASRKHRADNSTCNSGLRPNLATLNLIAPKIALPKDEWILPVEKRDIAQSSRSRLPEELLRIIAINLTDSDSISLQPASQRFRYRLDSPNPLDINRSEAYQLQRRLHEDLLTRRCLLEEEGLLGVNTWCASCNISHRTDAFSASQLHLSPRIRYCIGSKRVVRLCPHTIWSLAELRKYRRSHRLCQKQQLYQCLACCRRAEGPIGRNGEH